MNKNIKIVIALLFIVIIIGLLFLIQSKSSNSSQLTSAPKAKIISGTIDASKSKSDEQWRKILTVNQYHILRESGTEAPFTGKLEHEERIGTYYSVGCDEPLFRSEKKFDSGTGWPSFWAPINDNALVLREEGSVMGQSRIEVLDKCGGHLGHVFDDGPKPTGKRYCMNSEAMYFVPDKK